MMRRLRLCPCVLAAPLTPATVFVFSGHDPVVGKRQGLDVRSRAAPGSHLALGYHLALQDDHQAEDPQRAAPRRGVQEGAAQAEPEAKTKKPATQETGAKKAEAGEGDQTSGETTETLTVAFGRFNPPTVGHGKLLAAAQKAAQGEDPSFAPNLEPCLRRGLHLLWSELQSASGEWQWWGEKIVRAMLGSLRNCITGLPLKNIPVIIQ